MNSEHQLRELLQQRILVLDGAMGTMIQRQGLSEEDFRGARFSKHPLNLKGCNEVLSLTRHELISDIHREYLHAGADIIETNTFNATRVSLREYGLDEYAFEINAASARWARIVADEFTRLYPTQPRFVVGSMGPTGKSLSLSPDMNDPSARAITFDELEEAYMEQARGLLEGGVHALLVETVFDTLNAKAALSAIEKVFDTGGKTVPVMLSVTLSDASGRLLSGQTLEAMLVSLEHFPLLSVGLNCAMGAAEMTTFLRRLRRQVGCYVSAYPNAGLPNALGGYDETAEEMVRITDGWLREGLVNILGGCCGTTPEHIRLFAKSVKEYPCPTIPEIPRVSRLSGLEPLEVGETLKFIQIGERTNVAGSRKFARLIAEKKYEEALQIARQQVEAGAQVVDVNMDDALLEADAEMRRFLLLLSSDPEIARVPVMIDSSDWNVLLAGVKCLQGKPIVNSISLKDGKDVFLERARTLRRYGAAVLVMAFDEEGQATSYFRKISICKRAYELLVREAGFPPEDIYFDPNVLTIATGIDEHNAYAADFIEAVRWIKQNLPGVHVSGGISNLSYAFRGNNKVRNALHAVFLYHAIAAGLDMGLVNAVELPVYEDIPEDLRKLAEELILNTRAEAAGELVQWASQHSGDTVSPDTTEAWRQQPARERVQYALTKGQTAYLDEDLEALSQETPDALAIVEGPLMDAMNHVGELFGQGKMFLPQVVKSARVMKRAVEILMPRIEAGQRSGDQSASKGTLLLATVKGDVHDIGKNMAGLILSCNGYNIIDLGVMIPATEIVQAAVKHRVDAVGLSGLITPSLAEMVLVAEEMERAGLKIPLLISGATTSEKHTALMIAPAYSGPVIYVRDAGRAVRVLNDGIKGGGVSGDPQREHQEVIRAQAVYAAENRKTVSYADACRQPVPVDWGRYHFPIPAFEGVKTIRVTNLATLIPYIDWTFFFYAWDIPGTYPDLLQHPEKGAQAQQLLADARQLLADPEILALFDPSAVFGIFPANAHGDDVRIYTDDFRTEVRETLHFLRNQHVHGEHTNFPCLADFIAPEGYPEHIGIFALTAGRAVVDKARAWAQSGDEYRSFLLLTLADRLAEALAEVLHFKVRTEYWAYTREEAPTAERLLGGKFQGIRPAPGYPSCPDLSETATIFRLLDAGTQTGIQLTENFAMEPIASLCGYYFSHPESRYFTVGPLGRDQLEQYAQRKGVSDLQKLAYLH